MNTQLTKILTAITKAKETHLFSFRFQCERAIVGRVIATSFHGYYNLKIEHPLHNNSFIILSYSQFQSKLINALSFANEVYPEGQRHIEIKHKQSDCASIIGLPNQLPQMEDAKISKGGITLPLTIIFDGESITSQSSYNCESVTIPVHIIHLLVTNNASGTFQLEQDHNGCFSPVHSQPFVYIQNKPTLFTVTAIADTIQGFITQGGIKKHLEIPLVFFSPSLKTLSQLWVVCSGVEPQVVKILKEVTEV